MTQQQWDKHQEHLDSHIMWPATKEEIVAACSGEDVDEDVMEEMKMKLPDGNRKYSEKEMHEMLVEEM